MICLRRVSRKSAHKHRTHTPPRGDHTNKTRTETQTTQTVILHTNQSDYDAPSRIGSRERSGRHAARPRAPFRPIRSSSASGGSETKCSQDTIRASGDARTAHTNTHARSLPSLLCDVAPRMRGCSSGVLLLLPSASRAPSCAPR